MQAYLDEAGARTIVDRVGDQIVSDLKSLVVETPSWTYADGGTRFGVFTQRGAARTTEHKLQDAATVHKFTGITPSVAVHALWDFPDGADNAVVEYAEKLGVRIGAVNPTLFTEQYYKYGALATRDEKARRAAIAHTVDCVELAKAVGSSAISLWLADGTNYPGQDDIAQRRSRLIDALKEIYAAMPAEMTMLVEYKPFEPAFYQTDIADWGMAMSICRHLGERAKVLVDIGHHYQSQNIEQIVTWLIEENSLGGFHLNDRRYADDDLTTASIDPYQTFRIFHEIITAKQIRNRQVDIAYMIDQSHNLKPKVEAMIQSVDTIHQIYAKALLVDRTALQQAQANSDIILAEEILRDAYATDTRPLVGYVRRQMGIAADAIAEYRASGYQQKIEQQRGG